MSRRLSARHTAIIAALTLFFGSLTPAWAAPARPLPPNTPAGTNHGVSHPAPARAPASRLLRPSVPSTRTLGPVSTLAAHGFTTEQRIALQQRQAQARDLKQFQGGEVVIIGTTALLIVLVVVLVVVLVD